MNDFLAKRDWKSLFNDKNAYESYELFINVYNDD
jgi:hypothetical protein